MSTKALKILEKNGLFFQFYEIWNKIYSDTVQAKDLNNLFKGAVAEQFVGQELIACQNPYTRMLSIAIKCLIFQYQRVRVYEIDKSPASVFYSILKTITYLLVTPNILFFCIAPTTTALKR